jgi:flagellar hook assembly protein FlgD
MMAVFNLAGQKVATLVDGQRQTGSYQVQWDGTDDAGRNLASGVYMYRVHFDGVNQATRKLLILR